MRIADHWFERARIDDDITLIWEPYADPLIRCNIWHIRGRNRDLLVDAGLGVVSLRKAAKDIFDKRITAVATHTHFDHIGGIHEFDERIVHENEASIMTLGLSEMVLRVGDFSEADRKELNALGYGVGGDELLSAVPSPSFDIDSHSVLPAPATQTISDGDKIDLGDRVFEILHLPGHSPGSIGLWEEKSGVLFSGDAIYDGPLLTNFPGADIGQYITTMKRLKELPVRVVHGGHENSFGRERLDEIADAYLNLWK